MRRPSAADHRRWIGGATLQRSRRRRSRRARRARLKPVRAQALPQRWSHRPRRWARRQARSMWRPGPSRREAPTVPPEEAWAAVRVASRAPEGCQRRGRRLQVAAVARRGRAPRGPARWVVVQARRALAQEREAAWERAAARPTGCWRAAGSTAPSAVEGLWAARLQLPWQRRRLVRQCRRRASAPTDCCRACASADGDDRGELGLLMPGEPKARRPSLARTGRDPGAGLRAAAGAGPQSCGAAGAAARLRWLRHRALPSSTGASGVGQNWLPPVAEHGGAGTVRRPSSPFWRNVRAGVAVLRAIEVSRQVPDLTNSGSAFLRCLTVHL